MSGMHAKISQSSPSRADVELNGVKVEDSIRGLTVTMRAGDLPRLELDPVVVDVSVELGDAQVYVSPATRHLLIMLGWTPPEVGDHEQVHTDDQDREDAGTARSDP